MTGTVSLTIKIDPALKETLKSFAIEHNTTLSDEVCQRLQSSLGTSQPPAIDSQHTEEHSESEEASLQLTSSELKQIRALLKKQKKKK
ncbi:hypothetical protein [Winslowiella iniecta]|uniref:Uncharacterized protein n=1 Tax=Winslowiella iniecta TaxID=1560201 RepID=A0A0L7T6Z6_9GAMM|nr:hypothetical protein [Winslowiella iniecta]KOC88726.1 hypothetical protein NG42_15005 [Winslowiella iniecta]KOC90961.1 hypothetical protein NG43_16195 [Winslowiella iniecta]